MESSTIDAKQTTKECHKCGNTLLAKMSSINLKFCTDCGTWINWYLDEGQSSPYTGLNNKHDQGDIKCLILN